MARVTEDDLLAAITELGKKLPKRPEGSGWQTVPQMAKRAGINVGAMHQRFRLAMQRGLRVERFTGSDYDDMGELVKQTWFRVKK